MDEKIDINMADEETLASLPGIGPARATQIVEYRTTVHPFEELIELTAVQGISERMVRKIEDQLTINARPQEETAGSPEVERVEIEEEVESETEVPTETHLDEDAPETGDTEDDEEPVVVTMLNNERERAETAREQETTDPRPSSDIITSRLVETTHRRHVHLWQQLVGIIVGAVLGSALTLALLLLLNGTLRFAGNGRATNLQLQLDEETSAIRQSQSSMTDEMGELTGRVAELDNDMAASEEAIGAVAEDVTNLEEVTAGINERLETIDLAAEKFDTFLTGLRDILISLQGLPPTPTATITITGTSTVTATVSPETTVETPTLMPTAEPTEAGPATRTPRPTATPLIETQ